MAKTSRRIISAHRREAGVRAELREKEAVEGETTSQDYYYWEKLDFAFTKTSLKFMEWIKLENIYLSNKFKLFINRIELRFNQ